MLQVAEIRLDAVVRLLLQTCELRASTRPDDAKRRCCDRAARKQAVERLGTRAAARKRKLCVPLSAPSPLARPTAVNSDAE